MIVYRSNFAIRLLHKLIFIVIIICDISLQYLKQAVVCGISCGAQMSLQYFCAHRLSLPTSYLQWMVDNRSRIRWTNLCKIQQKTESNRISFSTVLPDFLKLRRRLISSIFHLTEVRYPLLNEFSNYINFLFTVSITKA